MVWQQQLKKWIVPTRSRPRYTARVRPGMYHFMQPRDGQFVRFHLRVERDGSALLVAAASEAVWLVPPATDAAWSILAKSTRFRVDPEVHDRVAQLIQEIGRTDVRYPILQIDDPEISGRPEGIAPIQADIQIGPAGPSSTLIEKLWSVGILHLRFRSNQGAAILPLVAAIEHAEDIGMITGLRSTATDLTQPDLLDRLAGVGLDYLVLPWGVTADLHRELYHAEIGLLADSVHAILAREMTPVLEVALTGSTIELLEEELPTWIERGVGYVEAFAIPAAAARPDGDVPGTSRSRAASPQAASPFEPVPPQALPQIAAWFEDLVAAHPIEYAWLPPVPASSPQAIPAVAEQGPRAGSDLSIRVLPDGRVLPPRGPCIVAGNLLTDSWSTIWGHRAFDQLRQSRADIEYCEVCPRLDICAIGCPADPRTWATGGAMESECRK